MMKYKITLFMAFVSWVLNSYAQSYTKKNFVKVDDVTIQHYDDNWYLISVPFELPVHPDEDEKPKSLEEVINHDYIEDLTVRLTICFQNEFLKKKMGSKMKLKTKDLLVYFKSEVNYQILQVNRDEKKTHFLFPKLVAEQGEFFSGSPKLMGYVVEIFYNGQIVELEDNISFENYKDEEILENFKKEALSNANEYILIPGHIIEARLMHEAGIILLEE